MRYNFGVALKKKDKLFPIFEMSTFAFMTNSIHEM